MMDNTTGLVKYDAACLALKEAKAVDEVKAIRDKSQALAHYAKLSKNKELELDAAEIRIRAERRLGEIMAQKREAGEIAKPPGHNQHKKEDRVIKKPEAPLTLLDQGIDKNLADRARKLATVAESDFEATLAEHRDEQKAVTARTFAKLEKSADNANPIWKVWLMASESEQLEFLSMAGLQKLPDLSDGPVDAHIWAEFVAHRQHIRKPLRRQSAQKNYAILAGLTLAQQRECVDQTIANSWQGLFPPKGKHENNSGINKSRSAVDRVAAANPTEPDPEIDRYF